MGSLQILELLRLVKLQTTVVPAPPIITLLRTPHASANHTDRLALAELYLSSPQRADNLLCRVPRACHSIVFS